MQTIKILNRFCLCFGLYCITVGALNAQTGLYLGAGIGGMVAPSAHLTPGLQGQVTVGWVPKWLGGCVQAHYATTNIDEAALTKYWGWGADNIVRYYDAQKWQLLYFTVGPQVNINFTKQFRTEVRVLVGGLWAQQPAYTLDRNDASGKHISTITVNNTDKITSAMAGSVGFAYQPGERIALFVNAAYYGGRPNYNDFSYAVKGDKTYTSTLKPLLSGAMLTAGLYLHL